MLLLGIGILVLGILTMNLVYAQAYQNQSVLCVPNLNSNKSNDLQCSINNTDQSISNQSNSTAFFLNHSK